jgi:hypothetical protein
MNGRRLSMIFAPDKVKIEQLKRKEAAQASAAAAAKAAPKRDEERPPADEDAGPQGDASTAEEIVESPT